MSRTAACIARVRWVGMETGWRRGAPSGILPPRETGIQNSRQRRRSYTHVPAWRVRRSMACQARGLTDTSAIPSGAARHFWEPVMLQSTPQASVLTSSPASEETLSRRNSAPCRRAMAPTASAGYVEPVEVSLWTSVRIFGLTRSTSFSRRPRFRGCPHSTENSVTWAPTRLMISRISPPNCPATMTRTRSPGSTSEIADVSRAVRPEPGMMMTSPSAGWETWRRGGGGGAELGEGEGGGLQDVQVEVLVVLDHGRLVHGLDDRPRQLRGAGDHEDRPVVSARPPDE